MHRIKFYFDPVCPWCFQTARWMMRLSELGRVDLSWGVFSLEVQNAGVESDEMAQAHARSTPGLRTAIVVRSEFGEAAVGSFYACLGRRYHIEGQDLQDPDTVRSALADAGLEPSIHDRAVSDESTLQAVMDEHNHIVANTRSFGVPTMVLDGGNGPAIFGPVISTMPDDTDAVKLLEATVFLTGYRNFAELKRDRLSKPIFE